MPKKTDNIDEGRRTKKTKIRSNPKYEYCLEDADKTEKALIVNGTINDRLNCLALLCTRNPSDQNYKQLLQFCENQRNDVIYTTLKLLRDLIKEKAEVSLYIKARIVKSFDMGAKNQYIKDKVVEIIGVLARADIYTEDFINVLISRFIEKGKTLSIVQEALKSLFAANEELIFSGIEDFYYKNDNFRCQYEVLKFFQGTEIQKRKEFFRFYDQALTGIEEYPKEQKDLMLELLVNGLSNTVSRDDKVTCIEFVRGYIKSARSIISVLKLLMKIADPFTESYVLRVSRTTLLRNTRYEPEFLNLIYTLTNKDLFMKLVDNAFYYSVQSILALMLMAGEKKADMSVMFSLNLFTKHQHPVVRDVAMRLLEGEKIPAFDPFDKVYIEGLMKMLENKR